MTLSCHRGFIRQPCHVNSSFRWKTITYRPYSVVLVFLVSAKPEAGTSHLVRCRSKTLNNRNHMPRIRGKADECNSAELITQPLPDLWPQLMSTSVGDYQVLRGVVHVTVSRSTA